MNVQLFFYKREDIVILELSGRFLGRDGESVIKDINEYLKGQENVQLVVDLTKLEYIGSQGVATLVLLSKQYPIKIAAPVQLVRNTLILLRVENVVEICDTIDQAINSFKKA